MEENTTSDESSSTYSTDSSDEDGDFETAFVCGQKLQLPQGLCEKRDIFTEFFSAEVWNSFSDVDKQHLQTFLPNFPEDDDAEKVRTLQRLFDLENFKFGNPLVKFHEDLKAGYFRPDIARMRKIIRRAQKKEARYRYQCFREQLKHEIVESQQKLLEQTNSLPPGSEVKQEKRKLNVDYVSHRTRKRYFQILASIKSKTEDTDLSSDENYPEGPPSQISRKQKRHLNSIKNSLNNSKERLFGSTVEAKLNGFSIDLEKYITSNYNPFYINDEAYRNMLYQHKKRKLECPKDPELMKKGIHMSDVISRTQLPYIKTIPTKPPPIIEPKQVHRKKIKREPRKSPETMPMKFTQNNNSNSETEDSDSVIDAVTISPKKRPKIMRPTSRLSTPKVKVDVKQELALPAVTSAPNTSMSSFSSQFNPKPIHHRKKIKREPRKSSEMPPMKFPRNNSNSETEDSDSIIDAVTINPKKMPKIMRPTSQLPTSKVKIEVKQEPALPGVTSAPNTSTSSFSAQFAMKVEEIDNIDIMNTPIDLQDQEIDIMDVKPELMQDTHASFFSLIRDIICSTTDHRMNMYTLQERLKSWQENPISPLNDWYSCTDNWIGVLPSAITFLCGNASEQPEDFVPYMEYKSSLDVYQWIGAGRDSDSLLSSLCCFWLEHRHEAKVTASSTDVDVDVVDGSSTPPPPRCPTSWTVRKATAEEIRDYQEQERRRYDNPHKAFTYHCNGYEAVVGPLKGIYSAAVNNSNTKARGHTMLNADRPNFVTILSLVRDATARLPNGEGTRGDICELLKSSQYISSTAPDNILQSVVSGALDRMHTQWDPCVKYDPKRKLWIYLHRHRTEEDFERIHQQYQAIPKNKKPSSKKSPARPKPTKAEKALKTVKTVQAINPIEQAEEKVEQATPSNVLLNETPQKPKTVRPKTINTDSVKHTSSIDKKVQILEVPKADKTASLLLSNNIASDKNIIEIENLQVIGTPKAVIKHNKKDQDVSDSNVSTVSSPTVKATAKGQVVKILSPTHGKSLIIPTSSRAQLIKQLQEHSSGGKQIHQVVAQQLLQTIAAQQKQLMQKSENLPTESSKVEKKGQQQVLQGITPQQFQSMKGMTVLRATTTASQNVDLQNTNIVTVAVSSKPTTVQNDSVSPGIHIKSQGNLTSAQQQQLLQTLKQKVLPNSNLLTAQQQLILKQKSGLVQVQKQSIGQKITSDSLTKTVTSSQGPVVAKVLTNAAGQVISVESLLAHQKQHGTLPQGTTLRVQSSKSGQQNIIHLTGTTKANTVAQFSMAAQPNNVTNTLTTQPKLIVASQTTSSSTGIMNAKMRNVAKTLTKPQAMKYAQQVVNAKIIDDQKLVIAQSNAQSKPQSSKSVQKQISNSGTNTIRMLNAANLNLTTIAGKPVLLASKSHIQGQNVIVQAQQNTGGPSLVLQNPIKSPPSSSGNINLINQGNIVFSPQLRHQVPQVMLTSTGKNSPVATTQAQSHIVLGGQPIRLQTSGTAASSTQRVVLASQGQGGQIVAQQILLPAGFQGTAINIKALQGVKVIPIAQTGGKGGQSRQVFARVVSPNLVKQTSQSNASKSSDSTNMPSSGD